MTRTTAKRPPQTRLGRSQDQESLSPDDFLEQDQETGTETPKVVPKPPKAFDGLKFAKQEGHPVKLIGEIVLYWGKTTFGLRCLPAILIEKDGRGNWAINQLRTGGIVRTTRNVAFSPTPKAGHWTHRPE